MKTRRVKRRREPFSYAKWFFKKHPVREAPSVANILFGGLKPRKRKPRKKRKAKRKTKKRRKKR